MPVLLTLAAVGIVAVLMVIGWRRRWDPTPQTLPPVTLRSARAAAGSRAPLPPWYFPTLIASIPVLLLAGWLSYALHRPWIAVVGYVLLGAGWAARHTAIIWTSAETRIRRVAAVVRPLTLILGVVVAATTRSIWWAVPALVLFIAILPITDVLERRGAARAPRRRRDDGPPRAG